MAKKIDNETKELKKIQDAAMKLTDGKNPQKGYFILAFNEKRSFIGMVGNSNILTQRLVEEMTRSAQVRHLVETACMAMKEYESKLNEAPAEQKSDA